MSPRKPRIHALGRPAIDLTKRHFEGSKHGIVYVGTWLNDPASLTRSQPCLVLLHGSRPISAGRTVPCIIALDQAWRWAAHGDVGDPEHCGRIVADWLRAGYLPGDVTNPNDRLRVLDVVNTRLPDLINMPPKPKGDTAAIGEAVQIDRQTGRIISEREIHTDV